MKVRKLLRVTPLALAISLSSLTSCHRTVPVWLDHPHAASGVRMQDVTFSSAALAREVIYRVYLPASLQPGQKLPVVYLLHGNGGSFTNWSNYSDVPQYALRGMILVMPDGGSSYYMNAAEELNEKYEDYVTKDLIADVQARFPAQPDREHRAIVGVSMGGFAAIEYALARPDLFAFSGAISPAIDVPSRRFSFRRMSQWWRFRQIFGPVGSKERTAHDPFALVQSATPARTPYIYLSAGEQEPLLASIRRFGGQLKQRNFTYEFHTKPGGHDWNEWDAQIPGCFASLLQHLAPTTN